MLDQSFASSFAQAEGEERSIPPILVFRGDGTAAPSEPFRDFSKGEIPIGLHLAPSDEIDPSPWEDGATLILPYNVVGDDSWARLADERPFPVRNDSLYQIRWNPFIAYHPMPLMAILMLWYRNVDVGIWEVDRDGVAGEIEKYREADTEEHCIYHVVEIGPGLGVWRLGTLRLLYVNRVRSPDFVGVKRSLQSKASQFG